MLVRIPDHADHYEFIRRPPVEIRQPSIVSSTTGLPEARFELATLRLTAGGYKNSKCRVWCRLRALPLFIRALELDGSWTEFWSIGPKKYYARRGFVRDNAATSMHSREIGKVRPSTHMDGFRVIRASLPFFHEGNRRDRSPVIVLKTGVLGDRI